MRSFLSFVFSSACLLQIATALAPKHDILEPTSDEGWPGLHPRFHKREVRHKVALQQDEHFVWTSSHGASGNTYANMTLGTKEDELVVSMERFAEHLTSFTCSSNMVMAFDSNETYQHAIEEWKWVNFNEKRTFILVTHHPACGSNVTRQPWVVSNVDYDPQDKIVHLNATKKAWKDVAHIYTLDFGKFNHPTKTPKRSIYPRSIFDKIADGFKKIPEEVKKIPQEVKKPIEQVKHEATKVASQVKQEATKVASQAKQEATKVASAAKTEATKVAGKVEDGLFNHDIPAHFEVKLGKSITKDIFPKKTIEGWTLSVECDQCNTHGSLQVEGRIESTHDGVKPILKSFNMTLSPKSIGADVNLKFEASGQLYKGYNYSYEVASGGIPGLSIPDILDIGPTLQLDLGFNIDPIAADITIESGFSVDIPNDSLLSVDLATKKKDNHGWMPKMSTKPVHVTATVSSGIEVFVQWNIAMGITILTAGFQTDLALRLPDFHLTGSAKYDSQGEVCPNSKKEFGVTLDGTLGASLLVQAYAGAGDGGEKDYFINSNILQVPLYTMPHQCFAFGTASKGTTATDMGSASNSTSGPPALGSGLAIPSTNGKTKPTKSAGAGLKPSGKATTKTNGKQKPLLPLGGKNLGVVKKTSRGIYIERSY